MNGDGLPLIFTPQPEGGFTVTCPVLPELLTEGDALEEANANVADALAAVVEIYRNTRRDLPSGVDDFLNAQQKLRDQP